MGKESAFFEKGVLTPEEFVLSCDQLMNTCKTWQWEGGEKARRATYLPSEKQFLITRSVPCRGRVSNLENAGKEENIEEDDGDGGWLSTHVDQASAVVKDFDDLNIGDDAVKPSAAPKPLINITESH